jgi:ABC-2 type transport system ATP-binding protein
MIDVGAPPSEPSVGLPADQLAVEPNLQAAADASVVTGIGVTAAYGDNIVLSGIDFSIGRGITGLLGPNGSGKTTLLGHILGLRPLTSGQLSVFGLDPMKSGPIVRAATGYAPEHHFLPEDIRANDYVRHVAEVHGLPRREAVSRASDAIWWVDLGEERFRPLGTLSTGQRQRVKLAAAIAHDPRLVLLDEPTDGLDPAQRESMLSLIRRVGDEFDVSVLLSSHLLDEVERTCGSVLMIAGGSVVASGPISELGGDDGAVIVELASDVGPVAARITRAGCRVAVDRQRITVEPDGTGADLSTIARDAVAAEGGVIRRLARRRRTLEDVFLGVDR